MMKVKDYVGIGILLVVIIIIPFLVGNDYYLGVLMFTAFNCLTCTGLCLLMGYAGQISIGHARLLPLAHIHPRC